jgi:TRAP-type C4-dicarboxylate transport system substrate-binding protein
MLHASETFAVPAGAFALVASLVAGAGTAQAQSTLTISSWGPPNHLITRVVTMGWAAEVEKVTQGRVKFQMLAKHPSAPPGTFDAVRDGLVDVTFTPPSYTPARHVVTVLAELPGGGATSLINSVAFLRTYWRHLDKAGEFKGVKLLTIFTHGPGQMFNSKRPINSVADLRGLKIRTGGGGAEKFAQAFGISSFVKPAPESYELLSTGVADGVFFPMESVPAFKIEKIVKYGTIVPGGFYSLTFAFVMNERKWNALSKADQDAILSVSGEPHARIAGKAWDDADRASEDIMKKAGVQLSPASPTLLAEMQGHIKTLQQDWVKAATAKGVDGAAALADFQAELKKVAGEK